MSDDHRRTEVFSSVPMSYSRDDFLRKIRIGDDPELRRSAEQLLDRAERIARPKGMYRVGYITGRSDGGVEIDGVSFTSRPLAVNLSEVERVFPFIMTCGVELDELQLDGDELLTSFWLDSLKQAALTAARNYVRERIADRFGLEVEKLTSMNPGSADREVWPIEQQRGLFSLFGDVEGLIGVRLTESFLMVPNKTVSGIYFPTEVSWVNCQLCTRELCLNRKAPYTGRAVGDEE